MATANVPNNIKKAKKGGHQRMARGGHGFLGMACAPDGAEKAAKRLDKMAERLQLTDGQTAAFETFKANVTEAQTEMSDACAPLRDNAPATPLDNMEKRSAMLQLQLDALNQITPAFADFYDTLDDAQKSELAKMGDKKGKRGMHKRGDKSDDRRGSKAPASTNGSANDGDA